MIRRKKKEGLLLRLISIASCITGMITAKPIFSGEGRTLLAENVTLTERMIERLKELGIQMIYINDEATQDVMIKEAISEQTRSMVMTTLKTSFNELVPIDKGTGSLGKFNSQKMMKDCRTIIDNLMSELRENKNSMNLLVNIFNYDNNYVFRHSLNVTLYTITLALNSGFTEKQLVELAQGALFHDIGKILIPPDILDKQSQLTDEEFQEVKEHTWLGFEILRKIEGFSLLAAHCALQHHERLNGSGYPRGLKSAEIHEYAKIVAVADVFDALTTHRSYRRALLPHVALEVLFSESGTSFDPDIIKRFRDRIALYPEGMSVLLNTREKGVVFDANRKVSTIRPIVRIIYGAEGQRLEKPYELDLSNHLDTMITDFS
jgi:putative nucleotidyltransferase with HDIG domain